MKKMGIKHLNTIVKSVSVEGIDPHTQKSTKNMGSTIKLLSSSKMRIKHQYVPHTNYITIDMLQKLWGPLFPCPNACPIHTVSLFGKRGQINFASTKETAVGTRQQSLIDFF